MVIDKDKIMDVFSECGDYFFVVFYYFIVLGVLVFLIDGVVGGVV